MIERMFKLPSYYFEHFSDSPSDPASERPKYVVMFAAHRDAQMQRHRCRDTGTQTDRDTD